MSEDRNPEDMANYYYMQNNGGICPSGVPLWQPRAQQTTSSSEQDVLVKVLSSVKQEGLQGLYPTGCSK